MVGEVIDRFGQIDILVNCQGWDRLEPFVESSEETWEKLLGDQFQIGALHGPSCSAPT